jgi:aminoglycoside phosphotransferase (APT) family kinase protein
MVMPAGKMHADEVETDTGLVRRLLAAQFPLWADLPITSVHAGGTVYALYRLGHDMVVRLPLRHTYIAEIDKEHQWLPRLAPHLPLAIPVPLAKGAPGEGFQWPWSIYRWLEGEDATVEGFADPGQAARDLAHFIVALHGIDPTDGPAAGAHNYFRGVPLSLRDAQTRAAIASLDAMLEFGLDRGLHIGLDLRTATAAWDAALRAPTWDGPPAWIHGDVVPLNLLIHGGRLSAVIDWGGLAVADPAVDAMVAWRLFSAGTRGAFRAALAVDDATWARGRGWALSTALMALPYYHRTNPILAANARRTIDEVVADHMRGVSRGGV